MSVAIKWTGINAIHKGQRQNILLNNAKAYASLLVIYWINWKDRSAKGSGWKIRKKVQVGAKCSPPMWCTSLVMHFNHCNALFILAASNSEKYDQENMRNTLDICELWLLLASMITFH